MEHFIVTGAAGHLGNTIIRALLHESCLITGILSPTSTPLVPENNQLRYARADIRNYSQLETILSEVQGEHTTLIHTAGKISIAPNVTDKLFDCNARGTANILSLSQKYGIQKVVYVSSVHALPETHNGPIREVSYFNSARVLGGYAKTKAKASQLVLNACSQGLNASIVHPSGILGPFDEGRNHLSQLIMRYLRGTLPICTSGGYDFVDVRDVANACIRCAHAPAGTCYIVSGHYCTISELLTRVGALCGRKPPLEIPAKLLVPLAPVMETVFRAIGRRPLFTAYSLHALTSDVRFSYDKAQTTWGYEPRSLEQTIEDSTRWLMDHVL